MINVRETLVDEKSALIALCGDRQLLSQLATILMEDAPALFAKLETAIEGHHLESACRTIHSLHGLISNFYASKVVMITNRLEYDPKIESFDLIYLGYLEELKSSVARTPLAHGW